MKRAKGEILAIALSLVILGAAASAVFASGAENEQIADLTPWMGASKTYWTIFQDPAAEEVFQEVAKYAPGYDSAMVRACFEKMYGSCFDAFNVRGGRTVCFGDRVVAEYDLMAVLKVEASQYKPTWYVFKTESRDAIAFGVEYLLMMPYHWHGEGLGHCHVRYGNQGFEYLATDPSIENWWPTFFRPEEVDRVGRESILKDLLGNAKMFATMLPPVK